MRKHPHNYFILGALTIGQSINLSFFLEQYDMSSIVTALILTTITFGILFVIAFNTKNREYNLASYLLKIIVCETIISLFFTFIYPVENVFYSFCQCIFVSVYILIDLHLVMNNKSKGIKLDDHIYASMNLYIDLIRLFIKILELTSKKKDDKK